MKDSISTTEAKRIVRAWLATNDNPALKVTAKTVNFSDLARGSGVFVTVHGFKPSAMWLSLDATAKEHGFNVEVE